METLNSTLALFHPPEWSTRGSFNFCTCCTDIIRQHNDVIDSNDLKPDVQLSRPVRT